MGLKMNDRGQVEIGLTKVLSIGVITVFLSVAGGISAASYQMGALVEKVANIEVWVQGQQEKIEKIPVLMTDIEWIKSRLDQIADTVNAPKAKQ